MNHLGKRRVASQPTTVGFFTSKENFIGCKGGSQGVMADIELEKISKEIKDLINEIEDGLEADPKIFEVIRENLNSISKYNKKT